MPAGVMKKAAEAPDGEKNQKPQGDRAERRSPPKNGSIKEIEEGTAATAK